MKTCDPHVIKIEEQTDKIREVAWLIEAALLAYEKVFCSEESFSTSGVQKNIVKRLYTIADNLSSEMQQVRLNEIRIENTKEWFSTDGKEPIDGDALIQKLHQH